MNTFGHVHPEDRRLENKSQLAIAQGSHLTGKHVTSGTLTWTAGPQAKLCDRREGAVNGFSPLCAQHSGAKTLRVNSRLAARLVDCATGFLCAAARHSCRWPVLAVPASSKERYDVSELFSNAHGR